MEALAIAELLEQSRRREKEQTLFYRALAAEAEALGDADASERLNELHADEQHHLSRLTARLLELGQAPAQLDDVRAPAVALAGWEEVAREREREEVAWYSDVLELAPDAVTGGMLAEILVAERHHEADLRGKWMSA